MGFPTGSVANAEQSDTVSADRRRQNDHISEEQEPIKRDADRHERERKAAAQIQKEQIRVQEDAARAAERKQEEERYRLEAERMCKEQERQKRDAEKAVDRKRQVERQQQEAERIRQEQLQRDAEAAVKLRQQEERQRKKQWRRQKQIKRITALAYKLGRTHKFMEELGIPVSEEAKKVMKDLGVPRPNKLYPLQEPKPPVPAFKVVSLSQRIALALKATYDAATAIDAALIEKRIVLRDGRRCLVKRTFGPKQFEAVLSDESTAIIRRDDILEIVRRTCQSCQQQEAVTDERYCSNCRDEKIQELKNNGYLRPVPRSTYMRCPRQHDS